jgi:hypothetical protein
MFRLRLRWGPPQHSVDPTAPVMHIPPSRRDVQWPVDALDENNLVVLPTDAVVEGELEDAALTPSDLRRVFFTYRYKRD